MDKEIARWVKMSLVFHNLNKGAEARLGLSLVQYHLLVVLKDMPGCSPQKLAEAAGMHPSTLTQSLKRVEKKGAVHIAEDPRDSRKKTICLTRSGLDSMAYFRSKVSDYLPASAFARLTSR